MKDEYNSGNGCRIYLSVVVKYFFLKKLTILTDFSLTLQA